MPNAKDQMSNSSLRALRSKLLQAQSSKFKVQNFNLKLKAFSF